MVLDRIHIFKSGPGHFHTWSYIGYISSNQAQVTFIRGPTSDTYLQIRPRPLSYVVLDRIHIFKSGPGHFHTWSYIGYISSNQAQVTFICGPRSDTYLQIRPRSLSYVVLHRIHIFKSGPGHFHTWSYIGYISSNQAQATFIRGPTSDTYLQIRPRPLSYVVLDRIHIFKSGPGHFHTWSYIGYISSNQPQVTFIRGPTSDTYLQIRPRPLSYVVLHRIHIFKSGPGHFHTWS